MPECKEKKKSRVFKIFRLYHSPVGDTKVESLRILVSIYLQNLWAIRDDKHYLGTSYDLLPREGGSEDFGCVTIKLTRSPHPPPSLLRLCNILTIPFHWQF